MINETLEANRAYQKDKNDAYNRGYKQGKADAEPHWIPITEQLPEPYEDVLLTCMDEVTIGWHYTGVGTGWAIYEGEKSVDEDEVKAWMPLPEPYKEATE